MMELDFEKFALTEKEKDVYIKTGWLSYPNAVPDPEVRVLCCTITQKGVRNHVIGYHDGTRWCCGMNSNVTHWMPLPDYPEEKEANDGDQ